MEKKKIFLKIKGICKSLYNCLGKMCAAKISIFKIQLKDNFSKMYVVVVIFFFFCQGEAFFFFFPKSTVYAHIIIIIGKF